MEKSLLDTDILSEILKQKDPIVLANAKAYTLEFHCFTFTAISVHEIIYGLESKRAEKQLNEARNVLAANDIIVPTLQDYEVAGTIRGKARGQGYQLALDDCLIATIASRLSCPLVT